MSKAKRAGMVKACADMKGRPGAMQYLSGLVHNIQPNGVEPRVIMHSSPDFMSGDECLF